MSSTDCSVGRHLFSIGYTAVSSVFSITILLLTWSLIRVYCTRNQQNTKRPQSWLFYTALIFVFLSMLILAKCIVYGLSLCNFVSLDGDLSDMIFNMIFADLYVIQLYFLWIVLFIRLYYIFNDTPYALSRVAIRIYSLIFILSPALTILLAFESFYTIFIVLGLSGGIFITLSMIILYIFKLIQVYTRYAEYNEFNKKSKKLVSTITKNTILIIICTLFSLLILFILIMNFIFSVYSISYGYQQQFLDICLLLDCYITCICILFQFESLRTKYEYFCGCVDLICRYYCKQFVNPSFAAQQQLSNNNNNNNVSVDLKQQQHNNNNNHNHLNIPFKSAAGRDAILSESEISPSYDNNNNNVHNIRYKDHNVIEMQMNEHQHSASYDTGHKEDFQDLPSLPLDGNSEKMMDEEALIVQKMRNSKKQLRGSHRDIMNNYNNLHYGNTATYYAEEEKQAELLYEYGIDSGDILRVLLRSGFAKKYIMRSLAVYIKHYGEDHYDLNVIREIIYRLTIKDKIKELKRVQNLYQQRDAVEDILIGLNFNISYISTALTMYEVMAEMFEINKHHENIYDLELVTEMIMRLRAKDRERGDIKATQEEQNDVRLLNEMLRKKTNDKRINTATIAKEVEEEEESEESIIAASVPSSKEDEEELLQQQQRYERMAGNIPFIGASKSDTGTLTHSRQNKSGALLDVIQNNGDNNHSKNNSANLLDVIADHHHNYRKHQNNGSRENTESLIEITANTNDMEVDGEHSDTDDDEEEEEEERKENNNYHYEEEEEEEDYSDDAPIETVPVAVAAAVNNNNNNNNNKQSHYKQIPSQSATGTVSQLKSRTKSHHVPPLADQYYEEMIANNNAALRAHHGMDSKGNINSSKKYQEEEDSNTSSDEEEEEEDESLMSQSIDLQEIYDAFCSRNGEKPQEPKYLIDFAKENGIEISFTEAITVINVNRNNENNLNLNVNRKSRDQKNKVKSYESGTSASNTPLPADLDAAEADENQHQLANVYSADSYHSNDDQTTRRIQSKIHIDMHGVIDTQLQMDDDMDDLNDLEADAEAEAEQTTTRTQTTDLDDMQSSSSSASASASADEVAINQDDDDSDLMDIEDADEYLLPHIPQIRPGDPAQNLMPVVPDNVAQHAYGYDHNHSNTSITSSSRDDDENESEEIEYEEEYFEDDDVFDEIEDDDAAEENDEIDFYDDEKTQTDIDFTQEEEEEDDEKEKEAQHRFYTNTPQQSLDTVASTIPIDYDYVERLNQNHHKYNLYQNNNNNNNKKSNNNNFDIASSDNTSAASIQSDQT